VPPIHHLSARLFAEQRQAVRCALPFESIVTLVMRSVEHSGPSFPSQSGTARSTVSSCDDHQHGAVEALQLERDERDTQCAYSS
jgi:hypothetical protein